jgi:hypothetical protein
MSSDSKKKGKQKKENAGITTRYHLARAALLDY